MTVTVKWYRFDEYTDEPLSNVIMGAHRLLKKFIETGNSKIDPILKRAIATAISNREKEIALRGYSG